MLLSIFILTIVLSIVMAVYNWNINKNTIFLAAFLILISIYGITHYLTIYGKSLFLLAIFFNNLSSLFLLLGPFLYFYVRGVLTDKIALSKKDLLHFIPFVIHFIGIIPYIFSSFAQKENIASAIIKNIDSLKGMNLHQFFSVSQNFMIRTLLLLGYVIYLLWYLWFLSPRKAGENIPIHQFNITYRWLNVFLMLLLFFVINIIIITLDYINTSASEALKNSYLIHLFLGITYLLITLSLLFFPQVLYGMPLNETSKTTPKKKEIPEKAKSKSLSEELINLEDSENPFYELAERTKDYLEKEKPFLNPNFSISDISLALKVPQHHISYCIDNILNTKFSKLKTTLRVENVKVLLLNNANTTITIDGIGNASGFSSRSNFYNAFKSETGLTPSEYFKIHKKIE